jgi:epoxide hydrolase 4
MPTLILWGKKDPYLKSEMAEASLERCKDGQLIYFEDATHWIQHEEPDRVNALMLKFFKGHDGD